MERYSWIKRGFGLCLGVALFFGIAPLCAAADKDVSDRKAIGVIRMFEINDLTGPTSETCSAFHDAFMDRVSETNKRGGISYKDPKTGKMERAVIKFDFGDNKGKSGLVPMLYDRMANQKPKPVVAWCGSSAACEIMPAWAQRDEIPIVAGPSGQPIWYPPRWSYVVTPDYPAQAAVAALWAIEDWRKKGKVGKPKWAWVTLGIPFGMACIRPESINYLEKLGFEIVGTWTIPYMVVDATAEISAARSAGANYIYGNTGAMQGKVIMETIKRMGIQDELQNIGCPYALTTRSAEILGAQGNGLVGVHYMSLPTQLDQPGVKAASELAQRHNREFNSDYMLGIVLYEMCVQPLKRALEKKGYPITGADVNAEFQNPKGFDLGGIMHIRPFTATERRGNWVGRMRGIKDEKLFQFEKVYEIPDMSPNGPWTPAKK